MSYKQCLLKAIVPADYNQEEKNYMKGSLTSKWLDKKSKITVCNNFKNLKQRKNH